MEIKIISINYKYDVLIDNNYYDFLSLNLEIEKKEILLQYSLIKKGVYLYNERKRKESLIKYGDCKIYSNDDNSCFLIESDKYNIYEILNYVNINNLVY